MHLADTFIQSDLHCIQVTVSTFDQLLLSLNIFNIKNYYIFFLSITLFMYIIQNVYLILLLLLLNKLIIITNDYSYYSHYRFQCCAASYFCVETMIHFISVFLMNRMFRREAFNWNIYIFCNINVFTVRFQQFFLNKIHTFYFFIHILLTPMCWTVLYQRYALSLLKYKSLSI